MGRCLAQPRHGRIVRPDGTQWSLTPSRMRVFEYLAEHPHQVRSREEIIANAADGRVVTDQWLYTNIGAIREALGDKAKQHEYIETCSGGYRLIQDVHPVHTDSKRIQLAALGLSFLLVVIYAMMRPDENGEAMRICRKAEQHIKERRYEDAVSSLSQLRKIAPHKTGIYEKLALVYNIMGEKNLAREEITRALELAQERELGDVVRLFLQRRKAQIDLDLDRERDLLKELLARQPQNPEWHFHLGFFYQTHDRDCGKSKERYRDAIRYSSEQPQFVDDQLREELLSCGPFDKPAHEYLAETLLSCGYVEEALRILRDYVESHPSAASHNFLGTAYLLTGRYEPAERELEKALELEADFDDVVLSYGKLAFARGAYRQAAERFEEYRSKVETANQETRALWHLGWVKLEQGDPAAAAAVADEALTFKEGAVQALWIRGLAEIALDRVEDARRSAERIFDLRQGESLWDMEYYHHLNGRIAQHQGSLHEAVGAFEKAVELNPADRAFFGDALAEAQLAKGDLAAAEATYDEEVFEFNPEYGRSRCGLAELYHRLGRPAEAADQYRACLRIFGPDNQEEARAVDARGRLQALSAASSGASVAAGPPSGRGP